MVLVEVNTYLYQIGNFDQMRILLVNWAGML